MLAAGGALRVVAGGTGSVRLTERVDLLCGSSTPAADLSVARAQHAAVRPLGGRLPVTGVGPAARRCPWSRGFRVSGFDRPTV